MSPDSRPGPDRYAQLDAAYLLDALSPAERADFEAHLAGCDACRARLAELTPVLTHLYGTDEALLDDATPEGIADLAIPDTVLPSLLSAAGRARRRQRVLVGGLSGVAAASLVGVVILASTLNAGSLPTAGPSGRLVPTSASTGGGVAVARPMTALSPTPVTAEVALQRTDWGTEIDLTCWYRASASAQAGYDYTLTVRGTDGTTHQLGTWRLDPGHAVRFTSGTALTIDQISAIDIIDGYGSRLLTLTN